MAKKAQYSVVDSKESFEALLTRVRQAQQEFARYSQERVDAIFKAAPWRPTRPASLWPRRLWRRRHGGRRGQGHQEPLRLRIYL